MPCLISVQELLYLCGMNTRQVEELIPSDFSNDAKVWIFQGSRAFIDKEVTEINEQLYQFSAQWLSHSERVKGWAKLLFKQFIVVMADDNGVHVGGCSTDGMMRVIKSLERQYSVSFFDRMTVTFLKNGKAEMLPFNQVAYALEKGYIAEDTLTFNNIATTKKELLESWLVPLNESWIMQRLPSL